MKMIPAIVLSCLGGLLPTVTVGQTIVWTDNNASRIQRKDVNDGEVETILFVPGLDIHYDPIAAKLYWRSNATGFHRANLDGSDPENILTPSWGKFTLNVESRKLYWFVGFADDVLYRSELDGSGVESHTYAICCLGTLEAVGDDLFFGAVWDAKGIWRADADGSNEQFLHGSGQPMDLAYDPVENKLYWASIDAIYRINPDGTGFQEIVPPLVPGSPTQVVVDSRGRKVYWAINQAKVIQRSNLDGSNVEEFITASDVGNPDFDIRGLTIVYNTTPIPTVSGWGLIVMGSILLGAGIFVLRKRRLTQSEGTTDG